MRLDIQNASEIIDRLKEIWEKATAAMEERKRIDKEFEEFNQSVIPESVLWKHDESTDRFTFIVPPFEKNPTREGTDRNLTQLLRYCEAENIQADIIFSVAEESPRFLIKRNHFVTYHYKTGEDGKISDAKCYDSVRDMDNSGFTGVLSKIANAFRWLAGAKPKRFFSVDQQATMQQSIKDGTGQDREIKRHYSGVQKNDIDCGYWSTVTAMKLGENPDISTEQLFKYLKTPEAKANMEAFKSKALKDGSIQALGARYKDSTPDEAIKQYKDIHVHQTTEMPKDKRTKCGPVTGLLVDGLIVNPKTRIDSEGVRSFPLGSDGTRVGVAVVAAFDDHQASPRSSVVLTADKDLQLSHSSSRSSLKSSYTSK